MNANERTWPWCGGSIVGHVVIALAAIALIVAVLCRFQSGDSNGGRLWVDSENDNQLAIGPLAGVDHVRVRVVEPAELDFMSKDEVLELRISSVERYPQLLTAEYATSEAVFGQIQDDTPWWGMRGRFYYYSGIRSIEGSSEESRFILNPYLLVAPEFPMRWPPDSVAEDLAGTSMYPFGCLPHSLEWYPKERRAHVSYDADCFESLRLTRVDLVAYNARDLNLNYIFVKYDTSINITKSNPPTGPYRIPQFIHRGSSCGYPGGCNNMSPSTPEIQALNVTGLPAHAVIWLWQEEPESVDQTPDMEFHIHFK